MNNQAVNKETIVKYLLGSLPEAETERFDELSITNNEFAETLEAAEKDLVDAYVQGELPEAELERFRFHYLASPLRREKVDFAQAFQVRAEKHAPEAAAEVRLESAINPSKKTKASSWFSVFTAPRLGLQWGFAAMALALLIAGSWLVFENARLRQQMSHTQARQESLGQREQEPQLPGGRSETPVATPGASPTLLQEGARVPLIAQVDDGGSQITLDGEGKLSGVDNLSPGYQRMVKEALTKQRLEKSAILVGLNRPASSLMSGDNQGNKFSVTAPVGKVMLSDRPTFGWSQLIGATGYVIEVYDEKFNLVASGSELSDNSWTPPQPLKRGGVYSWQVKAVKDGQEFKSPRPPAPQAKFRILDSTKAIELAQARRIYASSHLTMGLLYAQAGLLDEAEQELRALQKTNPNSAIVSRLLGSVQAMRR